MAIHQKEPLPESLDRPPLLEAVFEVRFKSQQKASDLLPGYLFPRLGKRYPDLSQFPLASFPAEVRHSDPNLRYSPIHRLEGEDGIIVIGDQIVGIAKVPPYQGWAYYKQQIDELLDSLSHSEEVLGQLERISLKVTNLLQTDRADQLSLIEVSVQVAGQAAPEEGFRLRTEFVEPPITQILQVSTHGTVANGPLKGEEGLIIEIDSLRVLDETATIGALNGYIEELHVVTKKRFFGLLKDDTLADLGPTYDSRYE